MQFFFPPSVLLDYLISDCSRYYNNNHWKARQGIIWNQMKELTYLNSFIPTSFCLPLSKLLWGQCWPVSGCSGVLQVWDRGGWSGADTQAVLWQSHGRGAVLAGVHSLYPVAQGSAFLPELQGLFSWGFIAILDGLAWWLCYVVWIFFLLTVISKEIIFNECVLFFLLGA